MPRLYELPTHLQVEDVLIAGLTARQLLRLVIGASLAYGVWDQVVWLPPEVRLALAAVLAVIGVLFALLRPGGRPLDQWLLAGLLFVVLPRRLVWRPGMMLPQSPGEQPGWAELELQPDWLGTGQLSHIAHGQMNQIDLTGSSGVSVFYLSMSRAIDVLIAHPHVNPARIAVTGFDAFSGPPETLAAFVQSELVNWGKLIKDAGIEPQ